LAEHENDVERAWTLLEAAAVDGRGSSNHAMYVKSYARFLADEGELDQAIDAAKRGLVDHPDDVELQWLAVRRRDAEGALQAACAQAEASHDRGKIAKAAYELASFVRDTDGEGARRYLEEAIRVDDPTFSPLAALTLGMLLQDTDAEAARSAYRYAMQADTVDQVAVQAASGAATQLGRMLVLSDVAAAEQAFAAAFERAKMAPHMMPHAASELGTLESIRGDGEGARRVYREAVQGVPATWSAQVAFELGLLLADNDPAAAIEALRAAVARTSASVGRAALNLGILLQRQGDLPEAREAFDLVIDQDGDPHAAVARILHAPAD
jgi:tetratricopeptide (TPR) repeat protein